MNRAYLVRQADYDVAALESAVDRIFSAFGFYEKLRETLYHEADAYIIPAGCEGEETDRILQEAGISVSLAEGVEIDGRMTLPAQVRVVTKEPGRVVMVRPQPVATAPARMDRSTFRAASR